jgi:hypothetical protein
MSVPGENTMRYKRRLRNYLLDAGLQLRYTAAIVFLATCLTAGLGYMIYQATLETSRIIMLQAILDPATTDALQSEFASKDKQVLWGILGFGVVLIGSVFGVGILITHRIAGPLFNIAAIFSRVRDNRIGPSLRGLRKGDELQGFFMQFREMHEAIRRRTDDDIRKIGEAVAALEACAQSPEQVAAVASLNELRKDKEASLEG